MHIHVSLLHSHPFLSFFFFFNDTATTEIYTLSLHDALPISPVRRADGSGTTFGFTNYLSKVNAEWKDRKSTRLNSSHLVISYAVFCLKKKKEKYSDVMLECYVVDVVNH